MLKLFCVLLVSSLIGVMAVAENHSVPTRADQTRFATNRHVGVSVPSQVAKISAEQSGTIVAMPLVEGAAVNRDQVLFALSSDLQTLRVNRLQALSQSNLDLRKAVATLEHAEKENKRLLQLSADDIASEKELQDRELDVVLAKLQHQQAELNQRVTANDLAQARVLLEQRTVRSPFAGIVTQILNHRGETCERLVPVIEVVKLDPLWVEFECPVTQEPLYRRGAEVLVSPAARADDTRKGKVVYVSMKANPSSHTFRVRIATPNKDHTWKSGLKMSIWLPQESRDALGRPPK